MTLIRSISGIRGTIGGSRGENLTPWELLSLGSAFADMLLLQSPVKPLVLLGRDGRLSGMVYLQILAGVLASKGLDVALLELTTTPTIAFFTKKIGASGAIMLSASHNPGNWNALKLYNAEGEFLSAQEMKNLLEKADNTRFNYVETENLGKFTNYHGQAIDTHLEAIINYSRVNLEAIRRRNFRIVVDAINSSAALVVPKLLTKLGVNKFELINADINLDFAHNPEPLDEHLSEIKQMVLQKKADLGIVLDPDVDRLCLVSENGVLFGEEYTLVAIADYLADFVAGDFVNNVLSSCALHDLAMQRGRKCHSTAVGEVNVILGMRQTGAIIGGEGSGGIIIGDFHYGRDALLGIALFLSALAVFGRSASEFRARYPNYYMRKEKIPYDTNLDFADCLANLQKLYPQAEFECVDGIKMILPQGWVCMRRSNTEPILRIYAEAKTMNQAQELIGMLKKIF